VCDGGGAGAVLAGAVLLLPGISGWRGSAQASESLWLGHTLSNGVCLKHRCRQSSGVVQIMAEARVVRLAANGGLPGHKQQENGPLPGIAVEVLYRDMFFRWGDRRVLLPGRNKLHEHTGASEPE